MLPGRDASGCVVTLWLLLRDPLRVSFAYCTIAETLPTKEMMKVCLCAAALRRWLQLLISLADRFGRCWRTR